MSDVHTMTWFKAATAHLGLPHLCLYQLRHGGASEELLEGRRSISEIMARGRWDTSSSLRRYAKPAQLQKLLGSLPPVKASYAQQSLLALSDLLIGRRAPWLSAA